MDRKDVLCRAHRHRWLILIPLFFSAFPILAADQTKTASVTVKDLENLQSNLNIVWTCIAAFLVFFMQAGFAMVETGFTRAKNAVNIIMKNLMDFSVGSIAFFVLGFGLMFGPGNSIVGTSGFLLNGATGGAWDFTFFLFQTVFCAT
ncbi:MAG: hypothetical protein D6820_10300, partial [Lentisphaerae bacterium]